MNKTRLEGVKDKKTGLPAINRETGDARKREVSNRRVGYDFTFSVPESVSLYLAVNQDKVVEQVIAEALDETMATIEAWMETGIRVPARLLKEKFSKGSEAWKEQSDPIFRFWTEGDWWGFPFLSLSASRYFGDRETVCLYWPLGTVVITGPKALSSTLASVLTGQLQSNQMGETSSRLRWCRTQTTQSIRAQTQEIHCSRKPNQEGKAMINTSRQEKLARFERLSKREGIMTGTKFALEYCGEHGSEPVQEPGAVRVNLLVEHPFFQDADSTP
jgi:hypothetical protein